MSRAFNPSTPSRGSIQNGLIRFGTLSADVVDLHRPTQMHFQVIGGLHHIGASIIHLPPPDGMKNQHAPSRFPFGNGNVLWVSG